MKSSVNEGIKILTSRQLGDGGFVYWPGNTYPAEWVTTYAGHFWSKHNAKATTYPNRLSINGSNSKESRTALEQRRFI